MDHQPGTDILKPTAGVRRPAISSLVAGLFVLGGCHKTAPSPPPDLPAVGGQVTILRVPREGGVVEAFEASHLDEPIWTSRASVKRVKTVLGVNLEARLLLAIDTTGALVGVDLESRGIRPIAAGVDGAVMVPNGSVYAMNDKRVTRYDATTPTGYRATLAAAPRFQFGTFNDRYAAVLATKPPKMVVWSADRSLRTEAIPAGEPAATYWGDLLGVATDREVLLYDTSEPYDVDTVSIGGEARHLAFSPSGHRLYVAGDDPQILVFDRFSKERLTAIPLPGSTSAFRTDGSGRWMMARAAAGDSVWIIDLATGRRVATVETDWAADLPTVAGQSLLVRDGDDLVASDLSQSKRPEVGRIAGGAEDLWTVTSWVPRDQMTKVAAAAESALVAQDSLLVRDSTPAAAAAVDQIYLQVSSSQNADWSRELAKQLSAAGYPAQVLDPTTVDEGFRVVVGPYPTREEAEEIGRKLGRPYFVLTNPKVQRR